MDQRFIPAAFRVGRFFCSDIYAFYQDTYKGDMGKVQVEALDYLHLKESTSIKELAARLNISKQHASKIASRLEELDYARKEPDPSDGRACLYKLTSSGKAFIQKHMAMSDRHFAEMIDSLPEDEQDRLLSCLMQAAEILDRCSSSDDL